MASQQPKKIILIVDDEEFVRDSIVAFLEDLDYDVLQAKNGQEGARIFYEQQPDLILSDLNMPVLDGLGFLRIVHSESPQMPFIVISGAGDIQYAIEALRLGAWDYVVKPIVEFAVLEHALNKSFERLKLLRDNQAYQRKIEQTNRELEESLLILRQDQEAGYRVQMGLLPPLHRQLFGLELDILFYPSLYLSGDFVDYWSIGTDYLCCYLADVSGHGVSSAFGTVFLKGLMDQYRAHFYNQQDNLILNPAQLLYHLSEAFQSKQLGKYLTIFYGVFDRANQSLAYSVGGHFPTPILTDQRGARYLEGRGFPIGVFPGTTYDTYEVAIEGAFNLACWSDGVLEILPVQALKQKEEQLLSLFQDQLVDLKMVERQLGLAALEQRPDDITVLQVKGQLR